MAAAVLATGIAAAWCLIAIPIGRKLGFVDQPDRSDLTAHEVPAIPLGGVGVYLAVNLIAFVFTDPGYALLVPSTLVLLLGIADDRLDLSPWLRLGVEIVAAWSLVWLSFSNSTLLFQVVGIVLVVVAINAVNLYDGLDGLAGLSAAVSALGLAVLLSAGGLDYMVPVAVAASLTGFLFFNWHPARVFLGDSGAYVTGLFLAYVILVYGNPSTASVLLGATALGVFGIDLVVSVLRRLKSGGRLFDGDRSHIYDRLRHRGYSISTVALISAGGQALLLLALVVAERLLATTAALVVMSSIWVVVVGLLGVLGFLASDLD